MQLLGGGVDGLTFYQTRERKKASRSSRLNG